MKFDYDKITSEDLARLNQFAGAAYSSLQGLQHTFLIAEQTILDEIPGAFVECGVAAGALAAVMAYAIQKHKQQSSRILHLFDSFEGIPLAGPRDHDQPGIGKFIADVRLPLEQRLKSSGISVGTVSQVKQNFVTWGLGDIQVEFHEGWFQYTLPITNIGQIAMLRLDGDLYESTQCCLKWLYPKVTPGGYIVHDDYPLPGSRAAMNEYFAQQPPAPDVFITVDTGAGYWKKSA